MWASKTPQQAYDLLAKPDIAVTNQTDKVKQLPKIQNLANEVYETVTNTAAGSGVGGEAAARDAQLAAARSKLAAARNQQDSLAQQVKAAQAAVEQAERELQALEQAAGSFAAIPVREVPWLMPRGEVPPSDAHYA